MFDIFKSNSQKIAEQQALINHLEETIKSLMEKTASAKNDLDEKEAKIISLNNQIDRLNLKKQIEVDKMNADRKIHDERMEHLVKLKTEAAATELERAKVTMQREKDEAIAEVKEEYRAKMEEQLEKRIIELKGMYSEVLERLPNVNASLKVNNKN